MSFDLATEVIVKERIASKLWEAEQSRLIREVRGSSKSEGWLLSITAAFRDLVAHLSTIFRPQVACLLDPSAPAC